MYFGCFTKWKEIKHLVMTKHWPSPWRIWAIYYKNWSSMIKSNGKRGNGLHFLPLIYSMKKNDRNVKNLKKNYSHPHLLIPFPNCTQPLQTGWGLSTVPWFFANGKKKPLMFLIVLFPHKKIKMVRFRNA